MDRKGFGLAGVVLAGVLVFGTAACGGGSDKEESSEEVTATVPSGDAADSSTSNDADDSSAASVSDFLDSDCQAAVAAYSSIFTSALGGSSMVDDAQKQELEDSIDELQSKVPEELEDDIATISDAYQSYFEVLGDFKVSDLANPENASKFEEAGEQLNSSEVEEAQQNIEDFFKENCPSMSGSLG
ncbi:MAG TPA: hypothetical protein VIY72_10270 [Acidimicrobiales bacterium]